MKASAAATNPATSRRTGGTHKGGRDHRSAVTNGKRLHVVRPGDTAWSRRFRDILNQIVGDLGGADLLSEGQRQLARRCATIAIQCEKMEGVAAAGAEIDLIVYGVLTDRLGRCFQRLGLERQARDVTPPSLHAYLNANYRPQDAAEGQEGIGEGADDSLTSEADMTSGAPRSNGAAA